MNITRENVPMMYPNDGAKLQSYMEIVVGALQEQYNNEVPEYLIFQLDLMRDLLKIYFKANAELSKHDLFMTSDTGRVYMNPAQKVVSETHTKILNLCKELGITIFSKKKIKVLDKKIDGDTGESVKELMENLLN